MSSASSRDFLEKVVPEVKFGGARNIVELAKALKMPVETTRYKVKGMLKRGLSIHASVDYNKFGLTHYYAYLSLSEKARDNEKKFFALLADQGYLTSYSRRLPSNEYLCKFALPQGRGASSSSLSRMLRALVEENLLESFETRRVSWEKSHMIQPEFFDLKHGTWEIDWSKTGKKESAKEGRFEAQEAPLSEFDDLDLMIARELEADSLTRLSDIADALKTTLNNIFYHFHKHILEGKIIEEYVIRWDGTPKQATMFVQFDFTNLTVAEEKVARNALRKLPFLWTDALSLDTGFYVGQAMVPQDSYLDTLSFLSSSLGKTAHKLKVHVLDPRSRQEFPLPAHLFKDNAWKFSADESAQQIISKLKK